MDVKKETVFSLAGENPVMEGCTISSLLSKGEDHFVFCFSLAKDTGISGEIYAAPRLYHVLRGCMNICLPDEKVFLKEGDAYFSPAHIPFSISAAANCIFLEIGTTKEALMNKAVEYSGVFQLKDVVPWQAGKVINRELIDTEGVRFAVISLSAGTILPEHAAPNDALLFALDGEAVFNCRGTDYTLRAGDNFAMSKGDPHHLEAKTDFKFALLLTKAE